MVMSDLRCPIMVFTTDAFQDWDMGSGTALTNTKLQDHRWDHLRKTIN
jgi:hypothetical protein